MTDDPTYIQENDSSSITESDNNQDDENAEILEGEHFIIPEVTLENYGLDEVEGADRDTEFFIQSKRKRHKGGYPCNIPTNGRVL